MIARVPARVTSRLARRGGQPRRGTGGGGALPGARCVAMREGTRWGHEMEARRFADPQKPRLAGARRPGMTPNGYAGDFTDSTYPRTSAAGPEYASPSASSMSLMNCSIRGVNS